jgi:hypothetical protein
MFAFFIQLDFIGVKVPNVTKLPFLELIIIPEVKEEKEI